MRRYSKKIANLALASSVAFFALTVADADARGRRPELPSVEIHLEVLTSLRQSMANRNVIPRSIPSRAYPDVTTSSPDPVYTGDSFAANVARQIPAATSARHYPVVSANTRHETIMQPLKGRRSLSVAAARGGNVIMQPLPKMPKVEPSEEQIVMQPLPGVKSVNGAEGSMIASVIPKEEDKGLFSKIIDYFDDSDGDEPELRDAPIKPEIAALPTIIPEPTPEFVTVPSAASSSVVSEVAKADGESFFSIVEDELKSPPHHPEVVTPPAEMVETVPALQPIETKPVESEVAKLPKLTSAKKPAPNKFVVAKQVRPVAPVILEEPKLVAPAVIESPVTPAVIMPEPVHETANESAIVANVPAVAPPMLGDIAQAPEQNSESASDDGFPNLSEVGDIPSLDDTISKIPKSSKEWMKDDAKPVPEKEFSLFDDKKDAENLGINELKNAPVVAPAIVEPADMSATEGTIFDDLLKEENSSNEFPAIKSEEQFTSDAIIAKPAVKDVAIPAPEPVVVPEPAPEPMPAPEPLALKKEPVEAPQADMTNADQIFLDNAASAVNNVKPDIPKSDGDGPTFMEMALEELEPAKDAAPEVQVSPEVASPSHSDDFALLKDVPKVVPEVIPSAPVKQKDEGMFPGITKVFTGALSDGDAPAVRHVPAPVAPPIAREETVQNVLPPELPIANKSENNLPSMKLLDSDVGNRFVNEASSMPELEDMSPVDVPALPTQVVDKPKTKPLVEEEKIELAKLSPDPVATIPSPSDSVVGSLSIAYGEDDTDIPDGKKSELSNLAKKAKQSGKRVIITAFASGTEDESKAANMVSLSRGLSLRAFFIDSGIAMDNIIVQAKGIDSAGGVPDRADISLE